MAGILKILEIKEQDEFAQASALYEQTLSEESKNQPEEKDILGYSKADVSLEQPAVELIMQEIESIRSEIASLEIQIGEAKQSQETAKQMASQKLEQLQKQETKTTLESMSKTLWTAVHKTSTTVDSLGKYVSVIELERKLKIQSDKLKEHEAVVENFNRLKIFTERVNQLESAVNEQLLLVQSNETASRQLAHAKLVKINPFLKAFRLASIAQIGLINTKIADFLEFKFETTEETIHQDLRENADPDLLKEWEQGQLESENKLKEFKLSLGIQYIARNIQQEEMAIN